MIRQSLSSISPAPPVKSRDPLYGWLLVAMGTAIIVMINGTFYSYGVFFKPLLDEFGWSRAVLSGPVSVRLIATGLFGIIAGAIVDRAGPRWVVPGGVLLVAAGFFLTSGVSNLWQMYLYLGLLSGIGMGVPFPAVTAMASRWITHRRGLAIGVVSAGYGIGQMIFPPLVTHWIDLFSWRTTFVILGLTVGMVGIPLGLMLKLPGKDKTPSLPGNPAKPSAAQPDTGPSWTMKESIRSFPLWQICLVYFLFSICLQAMMVHLVPHAIDLKIDPLAAAVLITIIGGSNTVGRIIGGGFSDSLGSKRSLILSMTMPAIALVALVFATGQVWLYVIAGVYGLGYGGISSAVPKLISEYYGVRSLGALLGVIQLAFAAGGAVGGPLAGYIYDRTGSYTSAFISLACLVAVAFVLCLSLHPPNRLKHSRTQIQKNSCEAG